MIELCKRELARTERQAQRITIPAATMLAVGAVGVVAALVRKSR